jgi:hypothetical protein
MIYSEERYTPEGFVSLDFAMVYIFALQMQSAAQYVEDHSWSFKVEVTWERFREAANAAYKRIQVTASQEEVTAQLRLRPPLANLRYEDVDKSVREFWWCGEAPMNVTVLSVRRALSSARLPSFIVDMDGKIVAVPAHFWNSDDNDVSGVLEEGRLALFEEHGGPVILPADDLLNWLKATGQLPSEAQALAPTERCRAYLIQEMRRSPETPPTLTVRAMRAQSLKMFPGLSVRGFDFAYKSAKAEVPESNWSRTGPRSSKRN